uniref:Putative secreted protein n=1 Tax=Anopheles darlingi TaxID=43151 RepID=A0A2M4DJQ1_ANODA
MSPGVAPPPSGCVALVAASLLRLIGSRAHGMDTSFQVGHDAIGAHEDALSTDETRRWNSFFFLSKSNRIGQRNRIFRRCPGSNDDDDDDDDDYGIGISASRHAIGGFLLISRARSAYGRGIRRAAVQNW